jgi:hypothetical protein
MANILAVLHPDGTSALDREIRGGQEQAVVNINLTFNDNGGEGTAELMIRNTSSNMNALAINVKTSELPTDNQTGNVLSQQWDFKSLGSDLWNERWRDDINIPIIPPGQFIRVRTRVLATSEADPVTHKSGIMIKYLRSSI